MRLVVDATARREQVDEAAPPDQVALFVTGEGEERLVGLDYQAVRHRGQVAAGGPVVKLPRVVAAQRDEERVERVARVGLV